MLGSAAPAHSIPTLAGGEGRGRGPWCHGHRPVYHSRAELIARISRVIVAYRKQNKGNYYSSLVGGPWLISLRAAARRQGNLTVLIKHSAAAQSNYRETIGLCWGFSPSWGPSRAVPSWACPACPRRDPLDKARWLLFLTSKRLLPCQY